MKHLLKASVAAGIAVSAAVVLALPGAAQACTSGWRFAAVYPQADGISSVSASSAVNAWAVGQGGGGLNYCDLCLFTAHWNGKKWQMIAAPKAFEEGPNRIVAYAQVAATVGQRAWVFGWRVASHPGTSQLSAAEWTGTSWSAVHDFPGAPSLTSAAAFGPRDVWVFGGSWAAHYNGRSWSEVTMPVSVSEASANAAAGDWVIGTVAAQPGRVAVLHWSKGAWRNVPLPAISVPKGGQLLPGFIAAATPVNVWASFQVSPVTSVLLHWNGTAWSKVPLPKGVTMYGLAADGHGGSWVASYTVNKPGQLRNGLVMYHYSGGHWTRAAVPTRPPLATYLTGGNMKLIPGTKSVLASATLIGSPMFEGAVLKYGP